MGDDDRASILARRSRFIAAALAGLAVGQACGDDTGSGGAQACLSPPIGGGVEGGAGGVGGTGGAQVCLSAPLGGGGAAGGVEGGGGAGGTGGVGGLGGAG